MSFVARLHAYQDMGYYAQPILTEAWYVIDNPEAPEDGDSLVGFFRGIARDFAQEHGDELEECVRDDFNWGDFVIEIPDDFLELYGVRQMYGDAPQSAVIMFTHHDELILE